MRTSRQAVVLKLRSIAPAMVPVAMKGDVGENATVAHLFTCLTYGCWYDAISPRRPDPVAPRERTRPLFHFLGTKVQVTHRDWSEFAKMVICEDGSSDEKARTRSSAPTLSAEAESPATTKRKRENPMNFLKRGFKAAKTFVFVVSLSTPCTPSLPAHTGHPTRRDLERRRPRTSQPFHSRRTASYQTVQPHR